MRINEVESLVGITKKNIRFYEQEGLLTPRRNRENGYRDYGEEEVRILHQVKLLRKLGLSLEEIRQLQSGGLTVRDAMARHQITLTRQQKSLAQSLALCQLLSQEDIRLQELDPLPWLERMETMEREGTSFMDKQKEDIRRKFIGPVVAAAVIDLLMIGLLVLFTWCTFWEVDPMPVGFLVFFAVPCVAVMVGVGVALRNRIKELQGGELNDAANY